MVPDGLGWILIDYISESTYQKMAQGDRMERAIRALFYDNDGFSIMRRSSDMITEQLWDDVDVAKLDR